ncbi:MAG: tRNA lysidine(34) synthetase TilS [Paludibacteraceae bacterium]|nr:tRNA lysidine(34) synthetase TilS [Paludibacteraceae bacterium]
MLRRVSTYIRKRGLLNKDKPVLVAVSGGADSVALLDVLVRAGYTCIAAHCNFHLRGEESNRDEVFVRDLCAQLNLPLEVENFDTLLYARTHHVGIEAAARELRYRWFEQIAQAHGCQAVAVAHHQNDQAETILLNLKRGTGLRGLAGMRPISANPMAPEGVPIVRPLLCTTRDYIEHYLRDKRQLSWVTDSTNSDMTISRNAVREQLKNYSKSDIEHMAQTAEYIQGYIDILEGRNTREAGIAKLYEDIRECGFAEIDKIYDALQRGEGGKTFRSKTHQATIRKGKLCVTTAS